MKSFFEKVSQFFYTKQNSPAWRVLALLMAGCIVFTTTYSMVLPAITIDQSTAEEMPGVFVEDVEESEGYYEEAAVEEEAAPSEEVTEEQTEPENDSAAGMDLGSEDAADEQNEEAEAAYTEPEYTDEEDEAVYTDEETDDAAVYADEQDTVTDEQTADEQTIEEQVVTESEEAPVIEHQFASELTYEGGDYTVTASFDTPIEYRDTLELTATEMAAPDFENEYNAYYNETVARMLEREIDGIVDARYFRFKVYADGQDIAPAGGVTFTLTYQNSTEYLYGETPYAIGFRAGDERQQDLYTADALSMQDGDSYFAYGYTFQVDGWDYSTIGAFRSAAPVESEESVEEAAVETETAASEEEVVEETTSENIDATSAAESVAEPVVEEEKFEGRLKFVGDGYRVFADITKEAGLPLDTELKVEEILPGDAQYEELLAQATAATAEDKNVAFARFFDISFMADGEEKEPTAGVSVRIEYSSPEKEEIKEATGVEVAAAPEASDVSVMHFGEEGLNEVEASAVEKRGKTTVEFESDAFSVYGIVYTVDFETVDGGKFSLPGGGSILLSELLDALNLDVEVTSVKDVGFSDYSLLNVEKTENDWVLVSLQSFVSEERLSITTDDGRIINIRVTDPVESSNLYDFLTNAVIAGAAQGPDGYIVEKGKPYSLTLTFKETGDIQFNNTSLLTYTMPQGIIIPEETENTINIAVVSGGKTYLVPAEVHVYTDGRMTIKFDETAEYYNKLANATNVTFRETITCEFDENASHIKFSETVERDVVVDTHEPTPDVGINKTATYDEKTGRFTYTITVTCTGAQANNVNVSDTITGNALKNISAISYTGNSTIPTSNPVSNGFDYTFPSMQPGEVITFTYTADTDFSKDSDNDAVITADQTKNTATVKSNETPEHHSEYSHQISYSTINKNDATIVGKNPDGTTVLKWTVEVNPEAIVSLNGSSFTDMIDSKGFPMSYSGRGPTISVYNSNGQLIETRRPTWNELNVTSDLHSFTYSFNDTAPYRYVFEYTTDVNTSSATADVQLNNDATFKYGSDSSHGNIPTDENNKLTIDKSVVAYNSKEVTWKAVIHVPPQGLTTAVVTDTLPNYYLASENGNVYDEYIADSITVEGRLSGEEYSVDSSDPSKVVITFRKGPNQPGLKESPAGHDIVVTLKTKVNDKWLKDAAEKIANDPNQTWRLTHKNTIDINGTSDTAEAIIGSADLEKYMGKGGEGHPNKKQTVTIDGKERTVFEYNLLLKNVSGDHVEVVDTFDTSILELLDSSIEVDNSNDKNMTIYGGNQYAQNNNDNGHVSCTSVNVTDTATGAIFTCDSLPKDKNGVQYSYYRICYYLVLKEGVNLEDLAANTSGGVYRIENEANWDGHKSSTHYDTEYDPLEKEIIEEASSSNRYATFRITFNAKKATLNDGNDFSMTDTLGAMLSLDYSSISFETDPAGVEIPYTVSGIYDEHDIPTGESLMSFTIPDATKVVVTYRALVIGQGTVKVHNDVDVLDRYHDEVDKDQTVAASGDGEAYIYRMTVSKVDGYDASKKLSGVKFRLSCEDTSVLPDPVELTTDKNGIIVIDGEDKEKFPQGLYSGKRYHLTEIEELDGYKKLGFDYLFTFEDDIDHVNYNTFHYFMVDSMQIKNWPYEGLILEKQVESDDEQDLSKKYKLRITLSGETVEGATYSDDIIHGNQVNGTYGDAEFKNGVAVVELKHNEQLSISDLPVPAGTPYTVEELDTGDFNVSIGVSSDSSDEGQTINASSYSGLISHDGYTKIVFNNKKDSKGSIKLIKTLTLSDNGTKPNPAKTYTFTISDGTKYYYMDGTTLKSTATESEGYITVTSDDEAGVTITGLPTGDYTVSEVNPASIDNYTLSSTTYKVDNGDKSTAVPTVTVKKDETSTVTTDNVYTPNPGKLEITKTLTINSAAPTTGTDGTASAADGTYSFEIWNESGTEQITTDASGTTISPLSITITNGVADPEKIEVGNLPAGKYIVVETTPTDGSTFVKAEGGNAATVNGKSGVKVEVTAGGATVPTAAFTNNKDIGYLKVHKEVTYNGVAPSTEDQKQALAGTYTFKVYTDESCDDQFVVKNGENDVTLTVEIGNDGEAKDSATIELPPGSYWVKEETPQMDGVTPEQNRIAVKVEKSSIPTDARVASFTNNKTVNHNPDEMAIDIEKTFTGLSNTNQIPANFKPVLTYYVAGNPVTVELGTYSQGDVFYTVSGDGMTRHWHVIRIPTNATGFKISEQNYEITGYERVTTYNGVSTPVADPSTPQEVTVLVPEIKFINFFTAYTTSDSYKVFSVTGNQILLIRMTNHATVIVSQKSLSKGTRTAIETLINTNGGKIPGDNAQAQWTDTYLYYSKEVQGSSFSYNGRTIYFDGDNVKIPKNASNQEVRAEVSFISESAENSFTIANDYSALATAEGYKAWKNADGSTTAPSGATVTLELYADDVATGKTIVLNGTPDGTVTEGTFTRADGESTGSADAYEDEAWHGLWSNLAKYQSNGTTEIVYTVKETDKYDGYEPDSETVASGGTITNEQVKTTAEGTKAWKNADGSSAAPSGATVTLELYADGVATGKTIVLNGTLDGTVTEGTFTQAEGETSGTANAYEDVAWHGQWSNLAKFKADGKTEIVYTVKEVAKYTGYEPDSETVASGGMITNIQLVDKEIKKEWAGEKLDTDKITSITYKITRGIQKDSETFVEDTVFNAQESSTATVTTSPWSKKWEKLASYGSISLAEGDAVTGAFDYTLEETGFVYDGVTYTVEKTESGYVVKTNSTATNKWIVSKAEDTFTNTLNETEFDFSKVWQIVGSNIEWPSDVDKIEIQLKRAAKGKTEQLTAYIPITKTMTSTSFTGQFAGTITNTTVDGSNVYTYSVTGLEKYADGNTETPWTYSISEKQVEGYNKPKYFTITGVTADKPEGTESENPSSEASTFVAAGDKGGVKIVNDKITVALPSTGGIGTTPYTIAGSLLMAFTALAYIFKKKRFTLATVTDSYDSQSPRDRK